MSYVEVLILRHLLRAPAHGYELRKHVEDNTGISLNNNALYPALRRFEESGAVTKTAEQRQGRPARHVYTLTAVGRELLQDLLCELPPARAGEDAEFLTRVAQFAMLAPEERFRVIDARETAVRERRARAQILADRATHEKWGPLVTAELLRRDDRELAWLGELRAIAAAAPVNAEGE